MLDMASSLVQLADSGAGLLVIDSDLKKSDPNEA